MCWHSEILPLVFYRLETRMVIVSTTEVAEFPLGIV